MKSLIRFDLRHFRGDLFGSLTPGVVPLPLALAIGVSSGLFPSARLYGAIFVSFFLHSLEEHLLKFLALLPHDRCKHDFYRIDTR